MKVQVSQTHMMDRAQVVFDDEGLVANAGVGLVSQLASHLGVAGLCDRRVGAGFRSSRKVLTGVLGMALGADSIDELDLLRAGATSRVLDFRPMASSTVGSWLRDFTWGRVRQLDSVFRESWVRAWQAGAGPKDERLFLDADSSICEVYGDKEGAAYSYNDIWSLHPLMISRGGTGEILGQRLRSGNAASAQGVESLAAETINAARRGGAAGEIVLRADSAFFRHSLVKRLQRLDVRYSLTAPDNTLIRDYTSHIREDAWTRVPYRGGIAEVAESPWEHPRMGRIIVRRVKNIDRTDPQQALFAEWKMLAFVTDREGDVVTLDREHRARAAQEVTAIREIKENALRHLPSQSFCANAAWLTMACMAHNITRHLQLITDLSGPVRMQATIRKRLLTVCGRLTRTGRRVTLHLPARWPWDTTFLTIVRALRLVHSPL